MGRNTLKFKVGKLYRILFWDHACGIDKVVKAEVVGWCIDDDANRVLLSHWVIRDLDESIVKDNYEYTAIVKDCVIKKSAL